MNRRHGDIGSVIAKLFAMILEHRIAVWAEGEGIKAKGQAGFRKDFRTTDEVSDRQAKADAWQVILLFCRFQEGI